MRLVIVSNRLPIIVESTDTGPQIRSSSGGLVSALEPILQQRGGLWIGWPGAVNSDDQAVRDLLGAPAGAPAFSTFPGPPLELLGL